MPEGKGNVGGVAWSESLMRASLKTQVWMPQSGWPPLMVALERQESVVALHVDIKLVLDSLRP